MELVANIWPVADQQTGLVQRFFMRAYALEADDDTISRTLTALAPSDWLTARVFAIPQRFQEVSPFGTLAGCVSLRLFHEYQFAIIEAALREWEDSYPRLQGIRADGQTAGEVTIPRFPENPYIVVTTLLETPDGRLVPQLQRQAN